MRGEIDDVLEDSVLTEEGTASIVSSISLFGYMSTKLSGNGGFEWLEKAEILRKVVDGEELPD